MNIESVRSKAFAMPLTSPAFPTGSYRFVNREFMIITYRTDPEKQTARGSCLNRCRSVNRSSAKASPDKRSPYRRTYIVRLQTVADTLCPSGCRAAKPFPEFFVHRVHNSVTRSDAKLAPVISFRATTSCHRHCSDDAPPRGVRELHRHSQRPADIATRAVRIGAKPSVGGWPLAIAWLGQPVRRSATAATDRRGVARQPIDHPGASVHRESVFVHRKLEVYALSEGQRHLFVDPLALFGKLHLPSAIRWHLV
jgi:hypothetical protein